jgi:hypothetical protein
MLEALITSKTRIRLLVRFFLNPAMSSYLRELAEEFGESTNAVRLELNRLTEAGILESETKGKMVLYKAKTSHPLFPDIRSIVSKITGIDQIIEAVIARMGQLEQACLVGDYAAGRDSGIIDLILVGEVNKTYLFELVEKAEKLINRRIRSLVMNHDEFKKYIITYKAPAVVLWNGKDHATEAMKDE